MKTQFNFERIVGLSSLFIASCAAFFSIIGIGMLFSGSAIASMIMASSLEIGKLVATTFLYRYWKKLDDGENCLLSFYDLKET